LFDEAYALKAKNFIPFVRGELEKKNVLGKKEDYSIPLQAVPEQFFPPCIQRISQGLQDGKKRAMFVLINFLTSLGWNYEQAEAYLREWNKHNPEPLREQLMVGHLRYHQQTKKRALPPNCANKAYMVAMGVCNPDKLCGANAVPGAQDFSPRIKNPVSYALKKHKLNSLTEKTLKKN
jgi:DNA primase large subunit